MIHRASAWIVLLFAAACSSKKPAPAAPMQMESAPEPAAAAPMSEPSAPEPAPGPGPDRAAVTSLLDQIETHLTKASKAKGHHVLEHADEIEKLVGQLDTHLAGYDAGASAYGKLKEHSTKAHDAAKKGGKGGHKDAHSHHVEIEAAVKELRATL